MRPVRDSVNVNAHQASTRAFRVRSRFMTDPEKETKTALGPRHFCLSSHKNLPGTAEIRETRRLTEHVQIFRSKIRLN